MRQLVTPANPNTAEQQYTRTAFSFLNGVYKVAPALVTAPWDAYAVGKVLTGRNQFQKSNLPILRPAGGSPATDLSSFVMSPGSLGGPPPASVVATPGNDQLSVAITAPAVSPVGWSIAKAVAAVIAAQDPGTDVLYNTYAAEDATSTYACVITGLQEIEYEVFGWLVWTRPDGKLAYSPSVQGAAATPT